MTDQNTRKIPLHIQRIKSLDLNGFRGIPKLREPLNTDADIVLITGPNGFGKTSVIDAICLLLSGYHYPERVPLRFCINGNRNPGEVSARLGVSEAGMKKDIEASVEIPPDDKTPPVLNAEFEWPTPDSRGLIARSSIYYQDLVDRLFDEYADYPLMRFLAPAPPEVDKVRKAIKNGLERLEKERTNLFAVPGMPDEESIKNERTKAVNEFIVTWNSFTKEAAQQGFRIPVSSSDTPFLLRGANLRNELRNTVNAYIDALNLADRDQQRLPPGSDPVNSIAKLISFMNQTEHQILSRVAQPSPDLFRIVDTLPDDTILFQGKQLKSQRLNMQSLQKQMKANREQLVILEQASRHFQSQHGPGIKEILQALKENHKEWLSWPTESVPPPPGIIDWLDKLVTSMDKLDLMASFTSWEGHLQARIEDIRNTIRARQEQINHYESIINLSQNLENLAENDPNLQSLLEDTCSLNGTVAKHDLLKFWFSEDTSPSPFSHLLDSLSSCKAATNAWLEVEKKDSERDRIARQVENTTKAREYLDSVEAALTSERSDKKAIISSAVSVPENALQGFNRAVNQVFSRFRCVKGLYPVMFIPRSKTKKHEILDILSTDGRPLSAFSTGQRAQLALSFLFCLNIALRHQTNHDIIALDDTSTAFDMAQLPREAGLLRQLAYGTGSDSIEIRRQLFIVSHHEDLTHRLIDFLIPPEGRSMRILSFEDWDPLEGPTVKQYMVQTAKRVSDDVRAQFGRLLTASASISNY